MMRSAQLQTTDGEYIDGHRFMYGDLGEHVARAAILMRDKLLRPGFVLPRIRLAPVASYGHCMVLTSQRKDGLDDHHHGIWLFLHPAFFGMGEERLRRIDETVLHETLHEELHQFGQYAKHEGEPWAQRCQEMSTRLGLTVRIERPRSRRIKGEDGKSRVTTATPDGSLSYDGLARWPHSLLKDGPPLRARLGA
jgi:hypothetical protein